MCRFNVLLTGFNLKQLNYIHVLTNLTFSWWIRKLKFKYRINSFKTMTRRNIRQCHVMIILYDVLYCTCVQLWKTTENHSPPFMYLYSHWPNYQNYRSDNWAGTFNNSTNFFGSAKEIFRAGGERVLADNSLNNPIPWLNFLIKYCISQ